MLGVRAARWALVITVTVGVTPVVAATTAEDCARIADAAARLACYDTVYSRPESPPQVAPPPHAAPIDAATTPPPAAAPAGALPVADSTVGVPVETLPVEPTPAVGASPSVPAARPQQDRPQQPPRQTEEAEFGLPPRSPFDGPGQVAAAIDGDLLTTTIAAVRKRSKQSTVFRLANGQIWMQTVPREVPIDEGDRVTIRRGLMGGYVLRNSDGVATRVGRIR